MFYRCLKKPLGSELPWTEVPVNTSGNQALNTSLGRAQTADGWLVRCHLPPSARLQRKGGLTVLEMSSPCTPQKKLGKPSHLSHDVLL